MEADPERQRLWAGDSPDTEVSRWHSYLCSAYVLHMLLPVHSRPHTFAASTVYTTTFGHVLLHCSGGGSEANHPQHWHLGFGLRMYIVSPLYQ